MELEGSSLLVTGGAGFVGSHLVDRLAPVADVRVADDLSSGDAAWLPDGVDLVEGDLAEPGVAAEAITGDLDAVFHFAADKTVRTDDPGGQFARNTRLTRAVLARMREVGVDRIAYTSSSTVYGEAPRPTPEDHGPLEPISAYGAAKLAEEALLSVYAHSYGFTAWVYRFANIVGPRLQAGAVIPDFIDKLAADPTALEILGDGNQEKSYMHVEDCVDAMVFVAEHADEPVNTYNLGTRSATAVTTIADVVSEAMGVDPEYRFTGGDRGWVGDVPRMGLSIEKLASLGWEPGSGSDEAVRRAARELVAERT